MIFKTSLTGALSRKVILPLVAVVCFLNSCFSIRDYMNDRVVGGTAVQGKVRSEEVKRIPLRKNKTEKAFTFTVEGCYERFAIFSSDAKYDEIRSRVNAGDTIIVEYRTTKRDYTTTIYRLATRDAELLSYRDYLKKGFWGGITTLVIGLVIVVFLIYLRRRARK